MSGYFRWATESADEAARRFRTSPVGGLRAAMVADVEQRWASALRR